MLRFCLLPALMLAACLGAANAQSPNGVRTVDSLGTIESRGTWSLGVRAGDYVFIAGLQGVDPVTHKLVEDPAARIRQAFQNIKQIAAAEGASLQDCVRLTIYVSDLALYGPMVEKAQSELWGGPPYPPRTMVEVKRLFDDDIVEIESTFYAPMKK
jgi:enamine deaminase RidA (YjgF/YER057c/UK114 family)